MLSLAGNPLPVDASSRATLRSHSVTGVLRGNTRISLFHFVPCFLRVPPWILTEITIPLPMDLTMSLESASSVIVGLVPYDLTPTRTASRVEGLIVI